MNTTTETAAQIFARVQAAGNEGAQFALMDSPTDLAAVENAYTAGARWSRVGQDYMLSMPGAMETLTVIFTADDTAEFGDSIKPFRSAERG